MQAIQSLLDQHQQQLPFDPPWFGEGATLGGVVACGLSGPSRISAGATRDFVLGTRLINGRGEVLRFGGEVMKNVAGYDVSRLMTGAMGTLGLLLDVSVKTLPKPAVTRHLCFEMNPDAAIQALNQWAAQPRPISASCQIGNTLHLRLAGHAADVDQTTGELGGEVIENQPDFWTQLREQRWPFFETEQTLWRLSLPPATPPLALDGETLYEWHGAQRWLVSDEPANRIRSVVELQGGHATQFRHADPAVPVFHPLPDAMMQLHQRLKQSFDPHGVFNPGRMYPNL
jgi:glycolate oxidase FAD binding subunit